MKNIQTQPDQPPNLEESNKAESKVKTEEN